MEFFLAYRAGDGEVHVLPSFHFPTAEQAREKIAQLRRSIEVDFSIVMMDSRSAA